MTDPRIYVAIVIGAAATWPTLFLYERVLKLMAFLQEQQYQANGLLCLLLPLGRYMFGILWVCFSSAFFILLPLLAFPPSHFSSRTPVDVYLLSFCGVLFARWPAFYRRMRALGITPRQRLQPYIPPRVIPPRNYPDDNAR